MTLVDTSVWVDHFRRGDPALVELLNDGQVLMHPFVRGELALGNLKARADTLRLLSDLAHVTVAEESEVLHIVESRKLMGLGIGLIDVHLLASAMLASCKLYTRDKRLLAVATELKIAYLAT